MTPSRRNALKLGLGAGGGKLGPYVRGPLRKPICRCDLRHSGREWVAWSQKRAEELR